MRLKGRPVEMNHQLLVKVVPKVPTLASAIPPSLDLEDYCSCITRRTYVRLRFMSASTDFEGQSVSRFAYP